VVIVEAVDELLAVDVPQVGRTRVPDVNVRIDDEVVFVVFGVHTVLDS
jgi:hypothetical protein